MLMPSRFVLKRNVWRHYITYRQELPQGGVELVPSHLQCRYRFGGVELLLSHLKCRHHLGGVELLSSHLKCRHHVGGVELLSSHLCADTI